MRNSLVRNRFFGPPQAVPDRARRANFGRIALLKILTRIAVPALLIASAGFASAAQLSTDARTAIPHDVQQLVAIDYRAMQNSTAAMNLKARVMPPELQQFEDALRKSGLNDKNDIDQYVDQLAFALFRPKASPNSDAGDGVDTLGIAQGQFPTQDIFANLTKKAVKPKIYRTNRIYPMGSTGMVVCFVDVSTMIFGGTDAVKAALDARDGISANMLTNAPIMESMKAVDMEPLWSLLDQKGTQTMLRQILGQAGPLTDFETVQKHLEGSYYSMSFQTGVHFDLTIATGDSFAAATISSLMNAALAYRKLSGSDPEKQALKATDISSDAGHLTVHFATSDTEFASLLQSPLFQSMVHP